MNVTTMTLDELINQELREGSFAVAGGRDLYMEVRDTQTGLVWMSAAPVQRADFESLQLDEGLTRVGIARAPMDRAVFHFSPAAPEQAVLQREINGRTYINVALPMEMTPPKEPGGPIEIMVNKAHVIGFEAGRTVSVLSLPEGDFIEVVGEPDADADLVLPQGGVLRQITLEQPLVLSLPTPTRTFFWIDEGMRSFQGPVELPV